MFRPGDRVILKGHWEFEDGIVGTVAEPPEAMLELSGPGERLRGISSITRSPRHSSLESMSYG